MEVGVRGWELGIGLGSGTGIEEGCRRVEVGVLFCDDCVRGDQVGGSIGSKEEKRGRRLMSSRWGNASHPFRRVM